MPFGLANTPATFQAYINKIFADLLDQFCVVYLDDILIFSDTLEDYKAYLITVFEQLASMHLYIKASKCEFEKTKISFLGYIISSLGIEIEEDRISTIKEWPTPKRFIRSYAHITAPIFELTKGYKKGEKKPIF
ncbi:hypothetical protein TEQG_08801 [Trichophyton equinum CBS 127.97]|uniref:Reverse transcriptase domain-containing protein n=1 Tax=Trichophyton equinum (strain ATCC MYA-4606 / CBS 127.97) TaxID=559882 RepID=F2Q2M1_TRIEC|nr:hypothetical protein TEQG_08801 [Trichophyton equinum CBS 127.97]